MLAVAFFLALLTAPQGVPVLADQSGVITGVLKDTSGKPAPGVRVGAIAVPDSTADIADASAMVSLAATDETGRYRLENIPPGRYYVSAGRVDFPTYYPGTTALARGTIIPISPKAVVDGIDFSMQDSSARVAPLPNGAGLTFSLPLQVKVEGGGKLPVFSPSGFLVIRLMNASNGIRTDVPINASIIPLPNPTAEFRLSIENLPPGYAVKSIMAGATELRSGLLRLSTLTFSGAPNAASGPMTSTAVLVVTLTPAPAPRATSGVRVAGWAPDARRRSIYLSGKPGFFYSDGTFEFRGATAGRHILASVENPESSRPVGASVIVGNRDLEGVELNEVAILPQDIQSADATGVANSTAAGSVVHLAAVRLSVIDEESHEPAGPGTLYILGPLGTSLDLPSDGRFEFPRLLPGSYSFEIRVFRHASITRTVVVKDEDVDLQLPTAGVN